VTLYSGRVTVILSGIYRYPVKSCRREELLHAEVEPWGLAGDRRWMIGRIVRDGSRLRPARPGRRLSRRQRPAAARAWPTGVVVKAPDAEPVSIDSSSRIRRRRATWFASAIQSRSSKLSNPTAHPAEETPCASS
jgi:uncharacterized protein YcbX